MREQAIFIAALQCQTPEARAKCLDLACGIDLEIRRRVEFLLRANAEANFLLHPTPGSLCETLVMNVVDVEDPDAQFESPNDRLSPDQQVGPFKLIRIIGEGGMGSVWEAEQSEPVRRRVALKAIKAGMESADMFTRFEAERNALALMDHPNVARVFEAGTTETGRPFIAMELVNGIPITQYCHEQKLTLDERVALMIPICQAIQHAHQNRILHGDIKPSNILVSSCDGHPVPMIIDFGLARTIDTPVASAMPIRDRGRIMGTLEYMSPEQADLNGCDVDPRSDVYSLGVLLYELLTGTTPLTRQRTQQSATLELLRLIREEEPPTPSTRVTAGSHQHTLIAQQRRHGTTGRSGIIPPELDSIVMRAVSKTRELRYASPDDLAADLQRYLRGDRIHACPASKSYWPRTFPGRRRAAVATTLAITAMMMIVTAVRFCQSQIVRVSGRAAYLCEILSKQEQRTATRPQDESERLVPCDVSTSAEIPSFNRVPIGPRFDANRGAMPSRLNDIMLSYFCRGAYGGDPEVYPRKLNQFHEI